MFVSLKRYEISLEEWLIVLCQCSQWRERNDSIKRKPSLTADLTIVCYLSRDFLKVAEAFASLDHSKWEKKEILTDNLIYLYVNKKKVLTINCVASRVYEYTREWEYYEECIARWESVTEKEKDRYFHVFMSARIFLDTWNIVTGMTLCAGICKCKISQSRAWICLVNSPWINSLDSRIRASFRDTGMILLNRIARLRDFSPNLGFVIILENFLEG